jgi:rhamnose utilization protein RhaD (predicted bifunctional aldolase and dehydrogenase)/NAD(P)-dependent dehydrogenase (short-subunit alcohol dehydrogenase family)
VGRRHCRPNNIPVSWALPIQETNLRQAKPSSELRYLKDLWDERVAGAMDEPEKLRYRSNLLGADLRITNFGGGNTSSKVKQRDPLEQRDVDVLWVKGSGGDLGGITRSGFATVYLDKFRALEKSYRGVEYEDEMVGYYPLCTFGVNAVAASIDTPLHGALPFEHVDHLHPDWATALAAAANGLECLEKFNRRFGHNLIWLPWQRPGFELAMMLKRAVEEYPKADGLVLGGHGLFTWGNTQRDCYLNSVRIIDQIGQFVLDHVGKKGEDLFGGAVHQMRADYRDVAREIFPVLRGRISAYQLVIGSFSDLPEVQRFINSREAQPLARLGTSCPDHFVRTKIRPLFVAWDSALGTVSTLTELLDNALADYRQAYEEYYHRFAGPDSPAMRNPNPTVVLIPGVGMFSFGKSKKEARLTGEFYVNAIHVMEGATALEGGAPPKPLPQAGKAASTDTFEVYRNYVALPLKEAFGIEYWQLEEAKLRRQPPEKELSRKVAFIVGAGSGMGRETALLAARRGAHVVAADADREAAKAVVAEISKIAGRDASLEAVINILDRESIRASLDRTVHVFGGIDILVNTTDVPLPAPSAGAGDDKGCFTFDIKASGNYLLASEAERIFSAQKLPGALVLTCAASSVVPRHGRENHDVGEAVPARLVRELSIAMAPHTRVNGISLRTQIVDLTKASRDQILMLLAAYKIPLDPEESTDGLRSKLFPFHAERTLTHAMVSAIDCAEAILFLASDRSRCTTGHLFPVDGSLPGL